jgi:hypothetical protein
MYYEQGKYEIDPFRKFRVTELKSNLSRLCYNPLVLENNNYVVKLLKNSI